VLSGQYGAVLESKFSAARVRISIGRKDPVILGDSIANDDGWKPTSGGTTATIVAELAELGLRASIHRGL